MKDKLVKRVFIFLIYWLVLAVFGWRLDWGVLFLGLGLVMSWLVPLADRLIYVYYTRPEEALSQEVQQLFRRRKWWQAMKTLAVREGEQVRLAFKNVLFALLWIPLTFFAVTSSGSRFSVGLVMGLGLNLLLEILDDWQNKEKLRQWLFWPVQRQVSLVEMQWVVVIYAVAFGFLTWLAR